MDDPLYQSTQNTWDEIWEDASVEQELETLSYKRAVECYNLFTPYLPRDEPILEAGCGLGAAVIHLRAQGFNVIGMDYVESALHKARAYAPWLHVHAGDVHALPYARASLGAYLSYGVLEHFPQGALPALQEAHRVLKPGGVLVLTVPYPNVIYRLVRWRQGTPRADEAFYETAYTRRELEAMVREVGFEVVLAQPTSHSFTLWGLGGVFRAPGYYKTSMFAELVGRVLRLLLPWAFNFTTLVVGRKV